MSELPLAERMRPKTLDEVVGQESLMGSQGVLRRMIKGNALRPFILWGPPGVGKTTIARLVAEESGREFHTLSAVHSGVRDVRDVLAKVKERGIFSMGNKAPVLFIDEIHRFNKGQQDSLLPAVERGDVVLVGATTENPSFEVNCALLSRCQVFVLKPLEHSDLETILKRAMQKDEQLKQVEFILQETRALYGHAQRDGRRLLNILEMLYDAREGTRIVVTDELVEHLLESTPAHYDRDGEMHYDIISAFIKSVRGSDPNAAVYWLARMLDGGEDPLFIARRLTILSTEDIGLADPNALLLANACLQSVHAVGMPEARIILSECAIYLACAPKSNSAYRAIGAALDFVRQDPQVRAVPLHIRNAPTRLMENLGYGKGYQYAHDFENHFVRQQFLPNGMADQRFYEPQDNPFENRLRAAQEQRWGKDGQ